MEITKLRKIVPIHGRQIFSLCFNRSPPSSNRGRRKRGRCGLVKLQQARPHAISPGFGLLIRGTVYSLSYTSSYESSLGRDCWMHGYRSSLLDLTNGIHRVQGLTRSKVSIERDLPLLLLNNPSPSYPLEYQ